MIQGVKVIFIVVIANKTVNAFEPYYIVHVCVNQLFEHEIFYFNCIKSFIVFTHYNVSFDSI